MRRTLRTAPFTDGVVIGVEQRPFFTDLYHRFLAAGWGMCLGFIVGSFLVLNALFAVAYWIEGGITNAEGLLDMYAFSVQTMATIGYGGMLPVTPAAHLLVIGETVVGLLFTALSTGLIFAKFTLSPAHVLFASKVAISQMNGVPTLAIRLGNRRGNWLVDVHFRLVMVRTEITTEGRTWYRMLDLPLQRDWAPGVSRSWTILHTLDADSPLAGYTAAQLAAEEAELIVTLSGQDETTQQPVSARHRYSDTDVAFGARHADMITVHPDGSFTVDAQKFDQLVEEDAAAAAAAARAES